MKTYYSWACAAVVTLLVACAPLGTTKQGNPALKPFAVKLEVAEVGGQMVLQNKNQKSAGCDRFPDQDRYRKGCIVAEPNEVVDVRFKLSGSGGWYFATFQICSASKLQKPADFSTCALSNAQRSDWLVLTKNAAALPDSQGIVDIAAIDAGLRQFTLVDVNTIEADYFYRVQVCTDNPVLECLWTDPGGQNKGRR